MQAIALSKSLQWATHQQRKRYFFGVGMSHQTTRSIFMSQKTIKCDMFCWRVAECDINSGMAKKAKTKKRPGKKATSSKWKPDQPYNAMPTLPPTQVLESRAVLKACIAARSALAELKQAAQSTPNQTILINTLPLLESQASSAIENIVITADKLFKYQQRDPDADPATKEALRYRQALLEGFRSIQKRPLNTRTAEDICSRIHDVRINVRKVPGTALANTKTGKIV